MAVITPPSITPVPTPVPQRNDRTTFSSRVDAFVTWLITAVTEFGNVATNVSLNATDAATSANTASTQAGNASTSATNANNSAIAAASSASTAAGFTSTSTSSFTIGTGSKVFTTQASKQFTVGVWVTISGVSPSNSMFGQVTAYSGTSLTVNVTSVGGSGTFASWSISLSGLKGDTGAAGTLSGAVSGNITGNDFILSGILLKDTADVFLDKGTAGTGTVTFDYTQGACQRLQVSGALTVALSNFAPSGNLSIIQLELVNAGSASVTFPSINWVKLDGTFTTNISTYLSNISRNALQTSGTDFVLLWTRDAGATVYGKIL